MMGESNVRKYIKAVVKRLKCSESKKKEIARQLKSDIQIAMENGETVEDIISGMGTPESMAADFNDNFTDSEVAAARKIRRWKILGAAAAIMVVAVVGVYWCFPRGKMLEESTSFNKGEVQQQTERIVALFDEGDYAQLGELSNEAMQKIVLQDTLEEVKAQISSDWGEFQTFGKSYMIEMSQMGKKYATVQINASYENVSVMYTITFDKDMKLAGFYVR